MSSSLLITYLIGHFLGDYYFQSDEIASSKCSDNKALNKHGLIYFISMLVVVIPLYSYKDYNLNIFIGAIIISLIHFFIDLLKKNNQQMNDSFSIENSIKIKDYIKDQVLHLLTIVLITFFIEESQLFGNITAQSLKLSMNDFTILPLAKFFQDIFDIKYNKMLSWVLGILIIIKPIQITIKIVLNNYKPEEKEEDHSLSNAGALIGVLERCIIFLLLAANQYAAIGFVLTAKSVARYNKIAEEHKFAEYFLLGTFLSTLLVILTFLIIL
jgi:hypothetical protein